MDLRNYLGYALIRYFSIPFFVLAKVSTYFLQIICGNGETIELSISNFAMGC